MSAAHAVKLPKKKIASIATDPAKSAAAVKLRYVSLTEPGIERLKKGKNFKYHFKTKLVTDPKNLQRIKSLAIPPAWTNVWICTDANGHVQATGLDVRERKQYRYHALWNTVRSQTKFWKLHDFGKALPNMRRQLEKDLALPGLPLQKVLAIAVSLMERTHIRVGNHAYEKLYGSVGLSTLKDKHVAINGSNLKFFFKGKKGVSHTISIKNKKLARLVKQCRDIPGKELFQYYDEEGKRRSIDSGMINEYIKSISGNDFTAKDFRTWGGTVQALVAFKQVGGFETVTEAKQKVLMTLDTVSQELGNTRAVCKKYYVHPELISLYENKKLEKYLQSAGVSGQVHATKKLTAEEKALMKILERF